MKKLLTLNIVLIVFVTTISCDSIFENERIYTRKAAVKSAEVKSIQNGSIKFLIKAEWPKSLDTLIALQ